MITKLIAEVGWSHLGDMDLAKRMIEKAASSGADYVKFQTWSEKRLRPGSWDNDGRREIYKKAELSIEQHRYLKTTCDSNGVKFLTSCFCSEDLRMIRDFSDEVKIASTECSNVSLIEKALDLFSVLYISTGATLESEYRIWADNPKVYLLHCVSSYPCPSDKVNMPKMEFLSSLTTRFGYSGHGEGVSDAIAAISLGATVVEKHFTIDRSLPGRDNKFAILPEELKIIDTYRRDFDSMMNPHGTDVQQVEMDARSNYRGRWEGSDDAC